MREKFDQQLNLVSYEMDCLDAYIAAMVERAKQLRNEIEALEELIDELPTCENTAVEVSVVSNGEISDLEYEGNIIRFEIDHG